MFSPETFDPYKTFSFLLYHWGKANSESLIDAYPCIAHLCKTGPDFEIHVGIYKKHLWKSSDERFTSSMQASEYYFCRVRSSLAYKGC